MMTVLIIVAALGQGSPISVAMREFRTEQACQDAGREAAKLHPAVRWVCVRP